ncbi:beta-ketoacyl-[acyl-carrier-protein] synthase family protein [Pantoea coffeiphila]|uniref:beta-ketoacyl-[acyl-carrier-protein] synthase family protein n=1 Tax=Pantoea coffeiphila TaxID=1465635 RepID=UPI001961244D|nr:beta-ketoacyl-[acyl-carrier-protein] synthase family protein [Pantoea coffeiphila]MBM7342670.1 3-oxoacyl-[acyl-carrier-protein] synthase-1 [Pantoea coffeiphila]
MLHRVAITGLGIVSSIGTSVSEVTDALYHGRSGIVIDPVRQDLGFNSPLTGAIKNFSPRFPLNRKQRKTTPQFVEWAAEAAFCALDDSGLSPDDIRNDRSGLIFGCDSSVLAGIEQANRLEEVRDTSRLGSGLVFQSMTSTTTINLNAILGTQGASWSISGACASSGHAVGQAADLIMLGRQDRIICGGAQEINWQATCSFDGLGAFSTRVDSPQSASRPFAKSRDGLVPGGGAAVLMLERYDLAVARRAQIWGEILGYGFSSDGENIVAPSRTGLGRAMRMALKNAELMPQDISYLCAHATATPLGDAMEAGNILDIFGERGVPVSSTKSMTGHELWMSGAAQVVYSCLMARNDFMAANINFDGADEDTSHLDIITEIRQQPLTSALCNSAGFGGTNSSLVIGF